MVAVVKVTRKYQITIAEEIRSHLDIQAGDRVLTEYDPVEGVVKIHLLHKGKRRTMALNRRLTMEGIEEALSRGVVECIRKQL